jgi:hypothetical protein
MIGEEAKALNVTFLGDFINYKPGLNISSFLNNLYEET